jgi:hypothetical protein
VARAAADQLVYLLDEAFEGIEKPWHSMLGNLTCVTEDDWLCSLPTAPARSARSRHAGEINHIRALSQRNDDA